MPDPPPLPPEDVARAAETERLCPDCGFGLLADGTCLRCAPPVMFRAEWLEPDSGRDIIPLQPHERRPER